MCNIHLKKKKKRSFVSLFSLFRSFDATKKKIFFCTLNETNKEVKKLKLQDREGAECIHT
jgi:hypothetical protein